MICPCIHECYDIDYQGEAIPFQLTKYVLTYVYLNDLMYLLI